MKVKYSNGVTAEVKEIKVGQFDLPTFDVNESSFKRSDVSKKTIEGNLKLTHHKNSTFCKLKITFDISRVENEVIRWKRVLFDPPISYSDSKIREWFTSLDNFASSEVYENENDLRYYFKNKDYSYEEC